MKFSGENAYLDLKFTLTDNNAGLSDGDVWCKVFINVDAENFHYEIERESLTKNEIVRGFKVVQDYYDGNKVLNLTFIKNYFIIMFDNESDERKMTIRLISLIGKKEKFFDIVLNGEEINAFINIYKESEIAKKYGV